MGKNAARDYVLILVLYLRGLREPVEKVQEEKVLEGVYLQRDDLNYFVFVCRLGFSAALVSSRFRVDFELLDDPQNSGRYLEN